MTFSGLLGSITKTADVNDCPGKCLHALASLLCEEVREDIACPSSSMRCCVDRRNTEGAPPTNELEPETTTKYRLRPLPQRTTTATTTTTTTTTTKRPQPAIASDKQDKYGDYEYTDSTDSDLTSASRSLFSMTKSSAFLVCTSVLLFLL